MKQLMEQVRQEQNAALDRALTRQQGTLAVRSIYDLFGPSGTLAALQSRGYVIEGP